MAVLNNLFKIIHSKFAFFKSKLRFFVKILMKFCRNFTNMLRMSRIFNFLKKKDQIFRKIRENFGNVQIQRYSVVSLGEAHSPLESGEGKAHAQVAQEFGVVFRCVAGGCRVSKQCQGAPDGCCRRRCQCRGEAGNFSG